MHVAALEEGVYCDKQEGTINVCGVSGKAGAGQSVCKHCYGTIQLRDAQTQSRVLQAKAAQTAKGQESAVWSFQRKMGGRQGLYRGEVLGGRTHLGPALMRAEETQLMQAMSGAPA